MPISGKTLAAAIMLPILLSGCFFHPTLEAYQDPDCDVQRHRFGLGEEPYNGGGCGSSLPGCVGAALLMGPVSLGISGSFVIVGDITFSAERDIENYWRKRAGKCWKKPVMPQAAPAAPGPQAATAGDSQHRR